MSDTEMMKRGPATVSLGDEEGVKRIVALADGGRVIGKRSTAAGQ